MHRDLVTCICGVLVFVLLRSSPAADPNDFLARTYAESDTGLQLPYRLFKPMGYNPTQQYPLVLFLHGLGEQGTDNVSQVNGNIDNLLAHLKMPAYSGFLLAPQTNSGWAAWGDEPVNAMRMSLDVIGQLASEFNIDPTRLYVTGLSMGGHGTWEVTWQRQGLFAASVPICGYGDTTKAGLMTRAPLWAFHAANDPVVPVEGSRNMIAAIRAAGGNPLYTEYPTGGHGIWGQAYNEPQLYTWMFGQKVPALVWDISTASGYQGGNGTWGSNNYWTLNGTTLGAWSAGSAVRFATSDGPWTVAVTGVQNVHSLIFDGAGYTLSGGTLLVDGTGIIAANKDATIGSILDGIRGVVKTGTGRLTLTAANTYAGDTRVGSGSLQIGHALALQNSTLDLNSASSGTVSFSVAAATLAGLSGSRNLTLPDSFTLSVGNNNVSSNYSGSLSGNSGLSKIGSGVLTLAGANSYTGDTTVHSGVLRLNHATALPGGVGLTGGSSNLTLDGGVVGLAAGNFTRGLGSGAAQVQWTASGGFAAFGADRSVNLGNAGATVLWGSGSFVPDGSALLLGSTAADRTVNFQNPIDLGDSGRMIQVDHGLASVDATLSGAISGGVAVTKTGAGMLSLTGSNAKHSGGWNIHAGGVAVSADTALGTGPLTLFSNATLRIAGTSSFSSSKKITLAGNATIDVQNTAGASVLGEIGGTGGLTKTGSGALVLARANTYSGTSDITAGSLVVKHPQALQSSTLSSSSSASVTFSGISNATLGNLQGSGNLLLPSNFALSVGGNNADATYAGRISGTGATLTKTGSGTLGLSSAQTYTGNTVIMEGTIKLGVYAPVAGAARWFDASNLGLANGASVTQWNDRSGNGAHATRPIDYSNTSPTYVANAGTGTGLGAVHFAAGSGSNPATNSQALIFAEDAAIRSVFAVFKGNSFLLTDTQSYHFHRPTNNDPTSPLWVGAPNYYTSANITGGSTYVNGVLVDGTSYPMPTSLHNGFNLVEVLTNGSPVAANGFNRDRMYHAGDQYQAEVLIYDRVLSAAERQQNEAYLNYKWFGIGSTGNVLPITTTVQLGSDRGAPTLDLNGLKQQVAALSDYSGYTNGVITNSSLTSATLTLNSASGVSTFSGPVTGAISLVKNGGNTQVLAGANSYTGNTAVNAGMLLINAPGSLVSPVTVNNGATLGGTGTLRAVTVNSGGHLAPGMSFGTLTLVGNLSLASGATLDFELDTPGSSDLISMPSQTLLLGSGLQFSNFAFDLGDGFGPGTYVLIDAGAIQGNVTPSSGALRGMLATLSVSPSGNDVVLNVVPEPSTLTLLGVGAIVLLGCAWRRRKRAG